MYSPRWRLSPYLSIPISPVLHFLHRLFLPSYHISTSFIFFLFKCYYISSHLFLFFTFYHPSPFIFTLLSFYIFLFQCYNIFSDSYIFSHPFYPPHRHRSYMNVLGCNPSGDEICSRSIRQCYGVASNMTPGASLVGVWTSTVT